MRIAVVAPSAVPPVKGGAERFYDGLVDALNGLTPHDAEFVTMPSPERTLPEVMASYQAFSGLDVSGFDLVVTAKYPAWMVEHPNHVVYMLHTLRGLYDTYPGHLPRREPSGGRSLRTLSAVLDRAPARDALAELFGAFGALLADVGPDHPVMALPGPLAYRLVHWLDGVGLATSAVQRYFAISRTVAQRRDYFPSEATVAPVYPPSNLTGLHEGPYEAFFTASRLDGPKRIDMLIEAMRYVPRAVPLLIAGTGPEMPRLQEQAAGDDRIRFLGYVDDDALVEHYARALAVPFVPREEDLGLITLEAMLSGKPVITTYDAGGPTEFVVDGVNGRTVKADPRFVGDAMAALAEKPVRARNMGEQAKRTAAPVTWEAAVRRLLAGGAAAEPAGRASGGAGMGWSGAVAEPAGRAAGGAGRGAEVDVRRPPSSKRPRAVVVSTFPVYPLRGGGQLRCFHLYRGLTQHYDVEVVSLAAGVEPARQVELAPGFVETSVPKSDRHERQEHELHKAVATPVTDIAASMLIESSPAYLEALERALDGAAVVLLAHPFMLPAVDAVGASDVPVVYDAHNAEFALKRSILPDNEAGRELVAATVAVEEAALRRSELVVVCSQEDARAFEGELGVRPRSLIELPNGTDTAALPFTKPADRRLASARWRERWDKLSGLGPGRGMAVFVGSWHPPNIDGALHIIEMAPSAPDVRFVLVGGHCLAFEGWRVPPNVVLLGEVSPLLKTAMLDTADVALNPMVRGSGTNLKIVEYMAAGTPVVSTPLGARGLDVEAGAHLLVADLDGFPDAVRALLDEPERSDRIAHAARALVEERYDWRTLGDRLLHAMAEALGERHAPALA